MHSDLFFAPLLSFCPGVNGNRKIPYGMVVSRDTLPEGVKKIGYCAFAASGLQAVALPATVESIGERAFAECGDLATVPFPAGLQARGIEEGLVWGGVRGRKCRGGRGPVGLPVKHGRAFHFGIRQEWEPVGKRGTTPGWRMAWARHARGRDRARPSRVKASPVAEIVNERPMENVWGRALLRPGRVRGRWRG